MRIALILLVSAVAWPASAQLADRPPKTPEPKTQVVDGERTTKPDSSPIFTPWLLKDRRNDAAEPRDQLVDLSPSRLFGRGTPRLVSTRRAEKGALRFGDGGWKTHVAQVGGMVAGFAALAALCSGNRCLLPKGLGSWIPGTTTEAPPAPARANGPDLRGLPTMRRSRK